MNCIVYDSLVALATLSITGGAVHAQSSVTLSGTLDAGLEKISGGELQLQNSRNGTTQITVSGVEDLGGGLKARFQISTAFDSTFDDGTALTRSGSNAGPNTPGLGNGPVALTSVSPTTIGNNGMFLALDGGFGSLILGRPINTLYGHSFTANGTKGVSGFAATNSITPSGIYTANAIQYVTPNLGGFTAQFEYAPSEQDEVKSTTSLALKYASGPFGVSLVRDNARGNIITGSGATNATKITQLAGFWDFGGAKLSGTYQHDAIPASTADQAWVLGLNVPVGAGQFWAQYGVKEAVGTDRRIVGLGYKHSLSKRTTAYVNVGSRNDAAAVAAGFADSGKSGFGLGLQHNF